MATWGTWLAGLSYVAGGRRDRRPSRQRRGPGARLRREVQSHLVPDAPAFALEVMAGIVDAYPTGSASISCRVALTWSMAARLGRRRRSIEEMAVDIGHQLPHLTRSLAGTGAGPGRPMDVGELAAAIRVAYEPGTHAWVEAGGDLADTVAWHDCGPRHQQEHRGHLVHDGACSITWEMGKAPRGLVLSSVLAPVLRPHPKLDRKRVTLLYRPHDPATSAAVVERDFRNVAFTKTNEKGLGAATGSRSNRRGRPRTQQRAGLTRFAMLVTATVCEEGQLEEAAGLVEELGLSARTALRRCWGTQAAVCSVRRCRSGSSSPRTSPSPSSSGSWRDHADRGSASGRCRRGAASPVGEVAECRGWRRRRSGGARRPRSAGCGPSPAGRAADGGRAGRARPSHRRDGVLGPDQLVPTGGADPQPLGAGHGRPALGKSTLVRRMATGLAAYGILPIVAGDTKPDYVDLVVAMGGHVVNLARGQGTLNPLDPGAALAAAKQLTGSARRRLLADAHGRRVTMVSALVTMNRQAAVSDVEEAVIAACLDVLDERHTENPATLVEMLEVLSEGPEGVRRLTLDRGDDGRYRAAVHGLESSIAALLQGAMGDTFAHPTSTPVNVNGPLCIDISGIPDSDAKLKVAVLLACWGETFGALAAAQALADAGKAPKRLWFIVLDELWRVLRSGPGLVERVDSLTRLNRQEGVGMALVIHTLKDLVSLTSEEDRTKAKGFAERAGYLAIGGVPAGEVPLIQDVVALSGARGRAAGALGRPAGLGRAGRARSRPARTGQVPAQGWREGGHPHPAPDGRRRASRPRHEQAVAHKEGRRVQGFRRVIATELRGRCAMSLPQNPRVRGTQRYRYHDGRSLDEAGGFSVDVGDAIIGVDGAPKSCCAEADHVDEVAGVRPAGPSGVGPQHPPQRGPELRVTRQLVEIVQQLSQAADLARGHGDRGPWRGRSWRGGHGDRPSGGGVVGFVDPTDGRGVTQRPGDRQPEEVAELSNVPRRGVGFVEDAVLTDGLAGHAEPLSYPPRGDRPDVGVVVLVDEQVRIDGVRILLRPFIQVSAKALTDGTGKQDDVALDEKAPVVQVGEFEQAQLPETHGVEREQGGEGGPAGVIRVEGVAHGSEVDRRRCAGVGMWELQLHRRVDEHELTGFEDPKDGAQSPEHPRPPWTARRQHLSDVLARDLPQRGVGHGPDPEGRHRIAQLVPDAADGPRLEPRWGGAAIALDVQPDAEFSSHVLGKSGHLSLEPPHDGGHTVLVEHPGRFEYGPDRLGRDMEALSIITSLRRMGPPGVSWTPSRMRMPRWFFSVLAVLQPKRLA